jgi:stage III sporulation protein AD
VLKIAVLSIAGIIMIGLLKNNTSAYSAVVQVALVIIIVLTVFPQIEELTSALNSFSFAENLSSGSIKIMLKIFAILTIGSITADICRDNGQNAVANTVELSVKILAISCALPVFSAVISVAASFFNR